MMKQLSWILSGIQLVAIWYHTNNAPHFNIVFWYRIRVDQSIMTPQCHCLKLKQWCNLKIPAVALMFTMQFGHICMKKHADGPSLGTLDWTKFTSQLGKPAGFRVLSGSFIVSGSVTSFPFGTCCLRLTTCIVVHNFVNLPLMSTAL